MNRVTLIGRLTRDPDIRYTQSDNPICIARYSLAVDRRYKKDGQQEADFPSCIAFGKTAEFAEKYLCKGMKIAINGRLQTGSYTNKDGAKVYTTDVVVEEHEFVESKAASEAARQTASQQGQQDNNQQRGNAQGQQAGVDEDGFMSIEDDEDIMKMFG